MDSAMRLLDLVNGLSTHNTNELTLARFQDAKPIEWSFARIRMVRPVSTRLAWLVYSLCALVSFLVDGRRIGFAFCFTTLLFVVLAARRLVMGSEPSRLEGWVVADATGISLDENILVRWQDVSHVLLSPTGVRLLGKSGGWLDIDGSREAATQLVEQYGFGAGYQATTLRVNVDNRKEAVAGPLGVILASLFYGAGYGSGWIGETAAICVLVCVSVLVVLRSLFWLPNKVTIGLDAILVHRVLGSPQTYPLSSVMAATVTKTGVLLQLTSGKDVSIACLARESELIVTRIQAAQAHARIVEDQGATGTAILARGDRPVQEWVQSLRTLVSRTVEQYRSAIDPNAILAVLEDPHAPTQVRVAAAIAMAQNLDDSKRTRLRLAIETAANPKLRVALQAVVEGDDAACEHALTTFGAG